MSLYSRLAASADGARALSVSRLRYQILKLLHAALEQSGLTQADLAKRLGVRRSAVNQVFKGEGNLRITTLAEYLHEMGHELELHLQPVGTQREAAKRDMHRQWRRGTAARALVVAGPSASQGLEDLRWHTTGTGSHSLVRVSSE